MTHEEAIEVLKNTLPHMRVYPENENVVVVFKSELTGTATCVTMSNEELAHLKDPESVLKNRAVQALALLLNEACKR